MRSRVGSIAGEAYRSTGLTPKPTLPPLQSSKGALAGTPRPALSLALSQGRCVQGMARPRCTDASSN